MKSTNSPRLKYLLAFRSLLLSGIAGISLGFLWGEGSQRLHAQQYSIEVLGFVDAEHTRADFFQRSLTIKNNQAGHIIGESRRYSGADAAGWSAWLYYQGSITKLGLLDSEHTSAEGYRDSHVVDLNEAGQAIGHSERLGSLGRSAWLYSSGVTHQIGFTDALHTSASGYRRSHIFEMNSQGHVVGYSERFAGDTFSGNSLWLYRDHATQLVGLYDAEHVDANGGVNPSFSAMNQSGVIVGSSQRYNGDSWNGSSAWIHENQSTQRIGLIDSSHTRSDGFQYSVALNLNESGHTTGMSQRFNGTLDLGFSAWLYSGGSTQLLGMVDSEHTRGDGYRYSGISQLNQAGQAIGYSTRFTGDPANPSRTAWLFDQGTNIRLGLTDGLHTSNLGANWSDAYQLNESGHVAGNSFRYGPTGNSIGISAWVYQNGHTQDLSFTGSEFTRTGDGYRMSSVGLLTESGIVTGVSQRFLGTADGGYSAWIYKDGVSTEVGMSTGDYVRADGFRWSEIRMINEAGQLTGLSRRYDSAGNDMGSNHWFYDADTATMHNLLLGGLANGYVETAVYHLGEDGLVLGSYLTEDSFGIGHRAFLFSITTGLQDLGYLLDSSFSQWDYLATAISVNGWNQIIGNGRTILGNDMPFLMQAISVPEPSATLFCGLMVLCFVSRRKRPFRSASDGIV